MVFTDKLKESIQPSFSVGDYVEFETRYTEGDIESWQGTIKKIILCKASSDHTLDYDYAESVDKIYIKDAHPKGMVSGHYVMGDIYPIATMVIESGSDGLSPGHKLQIGLIKDCKYLKQIERKTNG